MRRLELLLATVLFNLPFVLGAQPLTLEPPPKPSSGFFQALTPCFVVESNVSKAYTDKVATMVRNAEVKFYELFKLTPDLMNGVSKAKFDMKANIPGDIMSEIGFKPYVNVRVYKEMEAFSDEWFENLGVKDRQQRLRQGIPGAWFSTQKEYEGNKFVRHIRTFVSNRDDDELERTLLHEMGHLFMTTYLLAFYGDPPPGQESQKRGTPAWLGEGLAQFFELHWSKAASAEKARIRQEAMIYEAIQLGDSYPFDEFMNITNAHNLAAVAGNPLKATLNYAQSASVMNYMISVSGQAFFNFLQNLRALNFEKNLRTREKDHIPELYTFQDDAFQKAFNCKIEDVEKFWKADVKKKMDAELKKKPEIYYWVGEYYLRRGKKEDLAKAEEKFKLAMTQAPAKGEGYLGMGRMALRKNDNDAALTELTKAASLMPKDDEPWYYLGMAQLNTNKIKESIESFDHSLKIFPRSHRALSGMAWASLYSGQYDKAVDSFELAYQASRQPIYLFQKGQAAFFGHKYADAQRYFATYCDVFPMDPQGNLWYGLAAWRLNDKELATAKLEAAAKLNPADETAKTALDLSKKGETLHFALEVSDDKAAKPDAEKPKPAFKIEDD